MQQITPNPAAVAADEARRTWVALVAAATEARRVSAVLVRIRAEAARTRRRMV
jgi:hypothetical protein